MLVVLADPSAMNRRFLRTVVQGRQSIEVATFDDLLGAIDDLRPALVIVDPAIAAVSTHDLLDRLLATDPTPELLVVSGQLSVLEETRQRGVPAAAKRTLLDLSEIQEVVRRVEAALAPAPVEAAPPVGGLRLGPPESGTPPFGIDLSDQRQQSEGVRQAL